MNDPNRQPGSFPKFSSGFALPLQAAVLLLEQRRLWKWAVLPLLCNAILYCLIIGIAFRLLWGWDLTVPEWEFLWGLGGLLSKLLNTVLGPLKWLIAIPLIGAFSYFSFTIVGMVVATPFNDILSERVERHLCEGDQSSSQPLRMTVHTTMLSIFDAMRIVVLQLFFTALVLPLLLVPVVGFIPLFLVTGYFSGLGFVDVAMARNFLRLHHKRPYLRIKRWQILGLGVAMELLFFIPFVGLLLLPVGVIAGTLMYCKVDWTKLLEDHNITPPRGYVPPIPANAQKAIST